MVNIRKLKRIFFPLFYLCLFFVLIQVAGALLSPKYKSKLTEGSLTDDYYQLPKENTVIFIGDCEMYSGVNPVVMWEESKVASCVRATPNQTVSMSYYFLKETLEYEKPRMVVFSVLSLSYDRYIKEEYNRLTFDKMKFSRIKLEAVKNCTEDNVISYIFPVIRYHDRFDKLSAEDFDLKANESVSYMGYLANTGVEAYKGFPPAPALSDYSFPASNTDYLQKIAELCRDNDIELVLIKQPTLYPYWYEEWDENVVNFAKENDIRYLNLLKCAEEIGLDYSKDTYDGGYHLNVYGAEKVTRYLCKALEFREEYGYSRECMEYFEKRCKEYDEKYK